MYFKNMKMNTVLRFQAILTYRIFFHTMSEFLSFLQRDDIWQ